MQHSQTTQRIWQYFRQHRVVSIVAGHALVASILAVVLLGNTFGSAIMGAFAQNPCSGGDATYSVVSGDTLGTIASRYSMTWQKLTSYNHIANPNMIYINQHICIPGHGNTGSGSGSTNNGPAPVLGVGNFFPYPQCTRWAAERYFQMHHVYVPWTSNANAWQWTARAYDFRWHVSNSPSVGAIVDLQPWVQGAYAFGHVAVVERVLSNGHVIASNQNWGAYPYSVTNVEFTPGYGVTFITSY